MSVVIVCIATILIYTDWLWRIDRLIYDAQSDFVVKLPVDEIVIIAIDEISLRHIGRWPWSRRVHAQLLDILTEYKAKAVILDIIFAEPNSQDLEGDQLLAQAIALNGRTILPVLFEQTRLRGQFVETMPLPELIQAGAKIGHVHVELDADGIARESYLFEGLGNPHWPHIGLSALQQAKTVNSKLFTAQTKTENTFAGQWTWLREQHFLIPFVGPPGSFNTISYWNLLQGQVIPSQIENKIVLVGVTSTGLGDALPTPVSGLAQPMPGVEINANIVQGINTNSLIHRISASFHYAITAAFVLIPLLLLPYLTPRASLLLIILSSISVFIISTLVLRWMHMWMPVSVPIVGILSTYPLWSWQRLEFTIKSLNRSLGRLSSEIKDAQEYVYSSTNNGYDFLLTVTPIRGLTVFDDKHNSVLTLGNITSDVSIGGNSRIWQQISPHHFCRQLNINYSIYIVQICWEHCNSPPDEKFTEFLSTSLYQIIPPLDQIPQSTMELIESRIHQVRVATEKLAYLRRFIADCLEQMANGVIVTNSIGIITLANRQAYQYLTPKSEIEFLHQPLLPLIQSITQSSNESWESIIGQVLLDRTERQVQVRSADEKDLILDISPLTSHDNNILGLILNFSDITEIKYAERKRNEALEFLSHDLRSPLVSVLALLGQRELVTSKEIVPVTLFGDIENYINKTITLAENFVHLSRVESNDEISFSEVDVSDIVTNAIDSVWDQAKKKKISINNSPSGNNWVSGNGSILERVVVNLLTNAIKYSNSNSSINVTVNNLEDVVQCCVEDRGIGIAEEKISQLFLRFSQVQKNNIQRQGIGLGLAFVNSAINRHGGNVYVTSSPGDGSTFCFTLPRAS